MRQAVTTHGTPRPLVPPSQAILDTSRSHTLPRTSLATALGSMALAASAMAQTTTQGPARPGKVRVYVGTYTSGDSKGLYRLQLDLATGALAAEGEPTEAVNPSFVALHPGGRYLYAVNETGDGPRDEPGGVSAYAVDADSGALTFLNRQPSGGPAPCHLSLDKEGRHVLVANYWGGSVSVLPVQPDGRLGTATALVEHSGGTREPGRDPGPHAHAVHVDPADRFALVVDLGRDEVIVYGFDALRGIFDPGEPSVLSLGAGSGPRHLAFDPDGRHVFVINELSSTVSVLSYDSDTGRLRALQTVSTLPAGFEGANSTAEVVVSPDGRFLYGSNRGHDSIAVFAVDAATRMLNPLGHQPTLGKTPRNFALDPTGGYLLVANQDSDAIAVFRVDKAGGGLTPVGSPHRVPRPVCLRMVRMTP